MLKEYGIAKIEYQSPTNLVELFEKSAEKYANNYLFGEKDNTGKYQWMTYSETKKHIDKIRISLQSFNILEKNDAVGIIANNRSEWFICENAIHGLNCRWVPMYEKELPSIWKYVILDAEIKILFVSTIEIYNKLQEFREELKCLEKIIILEGKGENSYQFLLESSNNNDNKNNDNKNKNNDNKNNNHKNNTINPPIYPDKDDIAVLIYTSGTTGDPKGVLLSHGNLTFCSQSGWHLFPQLNQESISLSILPWAHSYGISAELHNWIQFGGAIGISDSIDNIAENLLKVRPTYLIAVPRIFNKIFAGLSHKMKEKGGKIFQIFQSAVDIAVLKGKTNKGGLKYKFFNFTLFKMIRSKLGGRMQGSLTASAKMDPKIAYFFAGIGIPVFDCYGMTETSPALTMNREGECKIGSVGKPVENTKIVIDTSLSEDEEGEGEILAFGPQVSIGGYHNKPVKSNEIFIEKDGIRGVRTGDKGHLDDDGYLFITGRFKEEYKLENGLYIHPASIEEKIKLLPWIANCFIYGDGKPYNVCIVVPDFPMLETEAKRLDLSNDPKELIQNKEIQKLIGIEIKNHLKGNLGGYEIPKKFAFLSEDFTVDNGLLTQTMKLKRSKILKKYNKLIEELY